MDFNFKGRDIINGYDFTTQELCHIMDTAMIYEKRVKSGEAIKDMEGMLVATLFFEPSTRTRLSFNSAIQRMGASTIDLGSASAGIEVIALTGTPTGEYWYSARQLTSCLKALGGTITLGIAQNGMLTISTQDAYYLQNVMRAPAAKKKVTKAAKPPAAKAA